MTTTWVFFAMTDDRNCTGFRYHNGDLTLEVQRQVVQSLRSEDRKNHPHCLPDCSDRLKFIIAYPLDDKPTTHGRQRWVPGGYELYLWERGRGMSELGWWRG